MQRNLWILQFSELAFRSFPSLHFFALNNPEFAQNSTRLFVFNPERRKTLF